MELSLCSPKGQCMSLDQRYNCHISKRKVSYPCALTYHDAIKAYGGVEV
jgi:hypothetical protein